MATFYRLQNNPESASSFNIEHFQQYSSQESRPFDEIELAARRLDHTKLNLTHDQEIKIYFIDEGAYFRNQLGVYSSPIEPDTAYTNLGSLDNPTLLFEDISCVSQDCTYRPHRGGESYGTPDGQPLEPGDFYDLGTVSGGTHFDFILKRDGYTNPNTQTWYTKDELNVDNGLQHVIAYEDGTYGDYLVLAWEDLYGGGDKDYNDVVFAIEFGKENISHIPSHGVPEPQTYLGLLIVLVFGIMLRKKMFKTSI